MVGATPLVTVLMPTHNRADVVGLAIRSVLGQTLADFELLVVGDGCTDGTAAVVAGFADPRLRWFDLPKAPGLGYANRNVALREARGTFVACAAHDDLFFPDHLEILAAELGRTGRDWAYSRPLWVSTDGVIVPFCTNLELADERARFFERENTIPTVSVMHRRAALEAAGFWPEDGSPAADQLLWRRILRAGGPDPAAYVRTPTALHFSADWKKSRHARMNQVAALLAIADAAPWWPPVLRLVVQAGTPEQAAAFDALAAGGPDWVDAVRLACRDVIDRIAWDDIQEVRPALRRVRADRGRLRRELEATRASLERLRASLSWRLTRPLRAIQNLAGRARRPG